MNHRQIVSRSLCRYAACVVGLGARCVHSHTCVVRGNTERLTFSAHLLRRVSVRSFGVSCSDPLRLASSPVVASSSLLAARRAIAFSTLLHDRHAREDLHTSQTRTNPHCKFHSGTIASDEQIIAACRFRSENYAERLGLSAHPSVNITDEQLKRYFFVLAKHFHPDSSSRSSSSAAEEEDSGDAFRAVKEAFDGLDAEVKRAGGAVLLASIMHGDGTSASPSFHFKDEVRRRQYVRMLGNGVVFFILTTMLLVYVIARHNKVRLGSTHWLNIVGIFLVLQLFPRMLAAVILFAWQTSYRIDVVRAQEQAKVHLVVTPHLARDSQAAGTTEERVDDATSGRGGVRFRLDGMDETVRPHVVVQVDVTTQSPKMTWTAPMRRETGVPVAPSTDKSEEQQRTATDGVRGRSTEEPHALRAGTVRVVNASTTLTMDRGVTSFILPSPPSNADGTIPVTSYHVRGVDQKRNLVLIDHTFTLSD